MTDIEHGEELRALFDDVDLSTPQPRDLIGPAMTWGRSRRRLDRFAAVGGIGVLAAAAVIGAVALSGGSQVPGVARRGGGGGDPTASAPASATPRLTADPFKGLDKAATSQAIRVQVDEMLPPGYTMNLITSGQLPASNLVGTIDAPDGSRSVFQIQRTSQVGQSAPQASKDEVTHQATTQNPIVSGTVAVPGGSVLIDARDYTAQSVLHDVGQMDAAHQKIASNTTDYTFTPAGDRGRKRFISLSELTTNDLPTDRTNLEILKANHGFNPSGPVLTPAQFAAFATNPGYERLDALLDHVEDLLRTS